MKKYNLRRNFTATFLDQETLIRGKLAFKTVENSWLDTESPVIVLVSVHSAFHEGVSGDLKMNALISTIKAHVKGDITILLSDRAHLRTESLDYQNDIDKAFEVCLSSAQALSHRYSKCFEGCKIVFWHSYICQDEGFVQALDSLEALFKNDLHFRMQVYEDVKASYTDQRKEKYPHKPLFIIKSIEDILEQCASLLVLARKGYRYVFYPGKPIASSEYTCNHLIPHNEKISWINVFLSIEKKLIVPCEQQV